MSRRSKEKIEHKQAWYRTVFVARRNLRKGQDMDKMMLDTAVKVISNPREMEKQEAMETEET